MVTLSITVVTTTVIVAVGAVIPATSVAIEDHHVLLLVAKGIHPLKSCWGLRPCPKALCLLTT